MFGIRALSVLDHLTTDNNPFGYKTSLELKAFPVQSFWHIDGCAFGILMVVCYLFIQAFCSWHDLCSNYHVVQWNLKIKKILIFSDVKALVFYLNYRMNWALIVMLTQKHQIIILSNIIKILNKINKCCPFPLFTATFR